MGERGAVEVELPELPDLEAAEAHDVYKLMGLGVGAETTEKAENMKTANEATREEDAAATNGDTVELNKAHSEKATRVDPMEDDTAKAQKDALNTDSKEKVERRTEQNAEKGAAKTAQGLEKKVVTKGREAKTPNHAKKAEPTNDTEATQKTEKSAAAAAQKKEEKTEEK